MPFKNQNCGKKSKVFCRRWLKCSTEGFPTFSEWVMGYCCLQWKPWFQFKYILWFSSCCRLYGVSEWWKDTPQHDSCGLNFQPHECTACVLLLLLHWNKKADFNCFPEVIGPVYVILYQNSVKMSFPRGSSILSFCAVCSSKTGITGGRFLICSSAFPVFLN